MVLSCTYFIWREETTTGVDEDDSNRGDSAADAKDLLWNGSEAKSQGKKEGVRAAQKVEANGSIQKKRE